MVWWHFMKCGVFSYYKLMMFKPYFWLFFFFQMPLRPWLQVSVGSDTAQGCPPIFTLNHIQDLDKAPQQEFSCHPASFVASLQSLPFTLGLGTSVVRAIDSVSLETTSRDGPHLVASCFPGSTKVSLWATVSPPHY